MPSFPIIPIDVTPQPPPRVQATPAESNTSRLTTTQSVPCTCSLTSAVYVHLPLPQDSPSASNDILVASLARTVETLVTRVGALETQNIALLSRVASLEASPRRPSSLDLSLRQPSSSPRAGELHHASPPSRAPSIARSTVRPAFARPSPPVPLSSQPQLRARSLEQHTGESMEYQRSVPFLPSVPSVPSIPVLGRRPRDSPEPTSLAPPTRRRRANTTTGGAGPALQAPPQVFMPLGPQTTAAELSSYWDHSLPPVQQPPPPIFNSPDFSSMLTVGTYVPVSEAPFTRTSGSSSYLSYEEQQRMRSGEFPSSAPTYFPGTDSPPHNLGS